MNTVDFKASWNLNWQGKTAVNHGQENQKA